MRLKDIHFGVFQTLSNIPFEPPYSCTERDVELYLKTYKKQLSVQLIKDYLSAIDTSTNTSDINLISLPRIVFDEKICITNEDLIEFYTTQSNFDLVTRILETITFPMYFTKEDIEDNFRRILRDDSVRFNSATHGMMMLKSSENTVDLTIDFIKELIEHGQKNDVASTRYYSLSSGVTSAINFINVMMGRKLLDPKKDDIYDTEDFKVYNRDSTIDQILE